MDVLVAAVAISLVSVLLVVAILLICQVRLTTSTRYLDALLNAWRTVFSTPYPACPTCGTQGRKFGQVRREQWWYCPACGQSWPETTASGATAVSA